MNHPGSPAALHRVTVNLDIVPGDAAGGFRGGFRGIANGLGFG